MRYLHSLFTVLLLSFPRLLSAQGPWAEYYSVFGGAGTGRDFIITAAYRAGNLFLMMIIGGAIIAIMWEAIGLQIGAGSDEGKENAKKAIKTALFGLMFALVAEALLIFLGNYVLDLAEGR